MKVNERTSRSVICSSSSSDLQFIVEFEKEHIRWDPKDGELFLHSVKPEEILVEAPRDTDVQIVLAMWV